MTRSQNAVARVTSATPQRKPKLSHVHKSRPHTITTTQCSFCLSPGHFPDITSHSLFLVVLSTNGRKHYRLATYTGSPATLDIRNFNLRKSQVKKEGKTGLLQFFFSLYTTQIIVLKMCLFLFASLEFGSQKNYYEGWNFNSGNYLFTTDTK